jgi:hypothetical protein
MTPKFRHLVKTSLITILYLLASSCSKDEKSPNSSSDNTVLVKVGRESLTVAELSKELPAGLTDEDSTKFARAYIRNWIDNRLVSEIAATDIDMTEIDKMVNEYRNQLIMWEYRRQMFESHSESNMPEDSILAFYNQNREDFKLSRPLIRGVYVKLEEDSKDVKAIKKLYKSTKTEDLDQLEKLANNSAIHYDYFRDKWIDWEQVESRIPYDFGPNPDAFIKSHRNLEISLGGFTYLLSISDYLSTGSIMPLETARPLIESRLINRKRKDYDANLRKRLYDNAIKTGKIKLNCDLGS